MSTAHQCRSSASSGRYPHRHQLWVCQSATSNLKQIELSNHFGFWKMTAEVRSLSYELPDCWHKPGLNPADGSHPSATAGCRSAPFPIRRSQVFLRRSITRNIPRHSPRLQACVWKARQAHGSSRIGRSRVVPRFQMSVSTMPASRALYIILKVSVRSFEFNSVGHAE